MTTTRLTRIGRVGGLVLLAAGVVHAWGAAAGTETPDWQTGETVQRQLAEPVHALWSGTPLREALAGISHSQRVSIWLDRRVDPSLPLRLVADGQPLDEVLTQIAKGHGLGLSRMGPVVYLGPPEAARRLRTLAELRREEAQRLGKPAMLAFQKAAPTRWDDLASPGQLLESLAQKNRLDVRGLERVPHDLWPAADWPAMPLVDRLTLLLVPFDLTFQVDATGRAIELVPVPEDVTLTRSYPGGGDPDALARRWAADAPDCRVWVEGDHVLVRGFLEDHEQLGRVGPSNARRAVPAAPVDLEHRRFERFEVKEATVREVLDHLARQLALTIRFDEAALKRSGISLDRRVSVRVENVSIDGLLKAVLEPAGLEFTRRGASVDILAAKP